MSQDTSLSTSPQKKTLDRQTYDKLKEAMLKDAWIFSCEICEHKDGWVESFHRPFIYLLAGQTEQLWLCLNNPEYKNSFMVKMIKREFNRLGVNIKDSRSIPKMHKIMQRVNCRVSRSTGKSTAGIDVVVWLATRNPNLSIGIASRSDPAAEGFLDAAGRIILSDRYRYFFPERVPTKNLNNKITKTAIWLEGRTNPAPEWTIEARGINSQWTGSHYNIIYADDICGTESGDATPQDAHRWMANVPGISINAALGGTREIYVGTIYGINDDHWVLSQDFGTISVVVPIWQKDSYTLEDIMKDGTPSIPEWYNLESCQRIREKIMTDPTQGPISWLQNFELATHNDALAVFSEDVIKRQTLTKFIRDDKEIYCKPRVKSPDKYEFNHEDWLIVDTKTMYKYMGIDQAVSMTGNKWAICVIAIDEAANIYICKVVSGHGYHNMLYWIKPLYMEYHPAQIGIDTNSTQGMTLELMQRDLTFQNIAHLTVGLNSSNQHKEDRIRKFVSGKMYMGELWLHPEDKALMKEMIEYDPSNSRANDDMLDALANAIAVANPGSGFSEGEITALEERYRLNRRRNYNALGIPIDPFFNKIRGIS